MGLMNIYFILFKYIWSVVEPIKGVITLTKGNIMNINAYNNAQTMLQQ